MAVIPGTEIDFKIEKEDWAILELDDGSRLKMRTILTKLVRAPDMGPKPPGVPEGAVGFGFNASFQNVVVVQSAPPDRMGIPTSGSLNLDELDSVDVGFTIFNNPLNIYTIEMPELPRGSKVKTQLVFSSVERFIGVYDQFGYSVYRVNTTAALIPEVPRKRLKKR